MKCHFDYDLEGLVCILVEIRYEKEYNDLDDILLNTIYCEWLRNKRKIIFDKFCNFMDKKNEIEINEKNIDDFLVVLVEEWKNSDEYLDLLMKHNSNYICEKETHYFKECRLGEHQQAIIEWLGEVYPKGYLYEEMPSIVNFVKKTLIIKGNYWDKETLIKDAVEQYFYRTLRKIRRGELQ